MAFLENLNFTVHRQKTAVIPQIYRPDCGTGGLVYLKFMAAILTKDQVIYNFDPFQKKLSDAFSLQKLIIILNQNKFSAGRQTGCDSAKWKDCLKVL